MSFRKSNIFIAAVLHVVIFSAAVFAVLTASMLKADAQDLVKTATEAQNLNPMAQKDGAKYTNYYYTRLEQFAKESPICKEDIVFLGNSLIEGGKWDTYFPAANQRLARRGGAIRNRGIIGDIADGISDRLGDVVKGEPKKIFLITGANDVSHDLTADSIIVLVKNLVEKIKAETPRTKIYMMSLLPINESFKRYKRLTGKTAMISEINAGLAEVARKEHVKFINLYPLFLAGGKADLNMPAKDQVMNPAISPDGLHVTAEGYAIWAKAIKRYVR
ncbi:MAG: GDSL-type esterase/lipase family protein [Bacteroidales bacterium]|jgi:lysophospholipase L1-like esterase|nr:GDSL-type esterase/lipase family protein [Bacteroidales bacterium]MCI1733782.1 GDSL-type esterase/lipase family protein [Bacteroidales bacterium]